jgi:hypothetical protein
MTSQTTTTPETLDSQSSQPRQPNTVQVFARHETFHPRFGWLKKGFDKAAQDSGIFLREDAPVLLGVGKNMVRSIRYWCSAFKILENDSPTDFGMKLLGSGGWDEYLEDTASLWLLHWKLLEAPSIATAWDFTFNQFRSVEFTQETLFERLRSYNDGFSKSIADGSLKKDIACLIRMYVKQSGSKSVVNEDMLDCPFAELGAIATSGDSRHYTFRIGSKPTLPASIVIYACLSYAARMNPTARTIPIANLLYQNSSPGLVFKLNERAICDAVEKVTRQFPFSSQRGSVSPTETLRERGKPQIAVSDAAGQLQFSFEEAPQQLAESILDRYYHSSQLVEND